MRVQDIIPVTIRKKLLKFHQNLIWKSTFDTYKKVIEKNEKPSKKLINKLIYLLYFNLFIRLRKISKNP